MMIAQDNNGRLLEVRQYGKSMYGGWYANYRVVNSNEFNGVGAKTLKGICEQLNTSKVELMSQVVRFDN